MKRWICLLLSAVIALSVTLTAPAAYAQSAGTGVQTTLSGVIAYPAGFQASWSTSTKVTGYQLQYSTDGKFAAAKTVKIGKNTTVSKIVSSLKSNTKYYVRVRNYITANDAA